MHMHLCQHGLGPHYLERTDPGNAKRIFFYLCCYINITQLLTIVIKVEASELIYFNVSRQFAFPPTFSVQIYGLI